MNSRPIKRASLGACLTVALGVTGVAMGATVELVSVSGTAMVSEGGRYVEGQAGRMLAQGDRVFGLENSSVVLHFEDGCRYNLKDNEVLTIAKKSPCANVTARSDQSLPAASADAGGMDPNLVVAGFGAAALIAAVAFDTGGDDRGGARPPISP